MTATASDSRQPGFFIIDDEVIDDYNLGPHAGWLYAVIVKHVNRHSGMAFPGIAEIAKKAGMSEPTAIKYLYELVEKRLICIYQCEKDDGSNYSNHYELLPVVKHVKGGGKAALPQVVKEVESNQTDLNQTEEPEEELPETLKSSVSEAGADAPPAWDDLSKGDQHKALFGALCDAWGYATDMLTEQDRKDIGKVANQLRGAKAKPEHMKPFRTWLDKHAAEKSWSDYTIYAMIKYWKEFAKTLRPPEPVKKWDFNSAPANMLEQAQRTLAWYNSQEGRDIVRADFEARGLNPDDYL